MMTTRGKAYIFTTGLNFTVYPEDLSECQTPYFDSIDSVLITVVHLQNRDFNFGFRKLLLLKYRNGFCYEDT